MMLSNDSSAAPISRCGRHGLVMVSALESRVRDLALSSDRWTPGPVVLWSRPGPVSVFCFGAKHVTLPGSLSTKEWSGKPDEMQVNLAMDKHPIQMEVVTLLASSCYENQDKLPQGEWGTFTWVQNQKLFGKISSTLFRASNHRIVDKGNYDEFKKNTNLRSSQPSF